MSDDKIWKCAHSILWTVLYVKCPRHKPTMCNVNHTFSYRFEWNSGLFDEFYYFIQGDIMLDFSGREIIFKWFYFILKIMIAKDWTRDKIEFNQRERIWFHALAVVVHPLKGTHNFQLYNKSNNNELYKQIEECQRNFTFQILFFDALIAHKKSKSNSKKNSFFPTKSKLLNITRSKDYFTKLKEWLKFLRFFGLSQSGKP